MEAAPRTLFDRLWDAHLVRPEAPDTPAVLYIDLHLVHEVTSPQAFAELRARGLAVRRPERTLATMDHSTPTTPRGAGGGGGGTAADRRGGGAAAPAGSRRGGAIPIADAQAAAQVEQLAANCREFGVPLYALGDERQGIVHVIGPELGLTRPGATIVCGDSHTSTHGAFGALAFGIGTSEVAHTLATQCLLQRRPRTMEVRVDGRLAPGVTAKDVILAVIARIGIAGGTGHVIEYTGEAIRALSMEERMTVCNMSIEAGARAGIIAPDETTFEYLAGRPFAPAGAAWEAALGEWRTLRTDPGAAYDTAVSVDAAALAPMITYGTNPGMGVPIDAPVPDPAAAGGAGGTSGASGANGANGANGADEATAADGPDGGDAARRAAQEKALRYMQLRPGQALIGMPIDVVFLGSCTNSRISDLRQAASLLRGRRVAPGVRMLVVPGSQQVKRQAEAEGLDEVFRAAGAEWREAGCSMCIAMNGDSLAPGQYAVSTSNRNFEGRQGKGGRTFLASPLTAAACAIAGAVADPRPLLS